jgi:hypothetical protein
MRKTHSIWYNIRGQLREMPLRAWARENQHYFPDFGFTNTQDDHPTTYQIRDFCLRNLHAQVDENERRVVVYL